ncbi:MAG TPA: hypothetical protein DEA90_09180 [Opitutae bacterium]|nr:hypothetical protein [Puniceicoccaceae bacterium]HBR94321.1 hypothetical protein [Opitutae bacterium]|tara:strand:- start:3902 stop:4633 length:732 start_codon:yes stop_codon:yes gene_type:complete
MNTQNNTSLVNDLFFDGQNVRIFGTPENPLFVRTDLGEILDLVNVRKLDLEPQDLVSLKVTSGGQVRELVCVTEMGLYELMFRSRTESAKSFRRWVCEVIREIRLKGYYIRTGLTDCDRRLKAAQLEVIACEHDLAAKRTRLQQAAVLANELPGATPVGALVHDLHPDWSQQKQASLCSRIVRAAESAGFPCGHTRMPHGKVRTLRLADFAAVALAMHLISRSQGQALIHESDSASSANSAVN